MTKRINIYLTDEDQKAIERVKSELFLESEAGALRYCLHTTVKEWNKPPALPESFRRPYQQPVVELPVIDLDQSLLISSSAEDAEMTYEVDPDSSAFKPPRK